MDPRLHRFLLYKDRNRKLERTHDMKKHMINIDFDTASLPDPSITIQEMNDYGYDWEGMLPLRDRMAFYWLDKTQIYCLYQDNTETAVDEVFEAVRHANEGGLFGIEVDNWQKIHEDKQEEEELPLLNLLRKTLGLEINERFDVVDPKNGQAAAHQCFFTKTDILYRNGEPISSELLADLTLGYLTIRKEPLAAQTR